MRRLFLLLFVLLGQACVLAQRTIHVPGDAPSIQTGIGLAVSGDTVLVAPGTYNENLDFLGKNITVTSGATSSDVARQTILNGTLDGPPTVWFHGSESRAAVLNGFTVQNGHNSAAQCPTGICSQVAAGVLIEGASPTLSNNIIQRNYGCNVVSNHGGPKLIGNEIAGPLFSESTNALHEGYCFGAGLGVITGTHVEITGNHIHDNAPDPSIVNQQIEGVGVSLGLADEVDLVQNRIHDNGLAGPNGSNVGHDVISIYNDHPALLVMAGNLVYSSDARSQGFGFEIFEGAYNGMNAPGLLLVNKSIAYSSRFLATFDKPALVNNNFTQNKPATEYAEAPIETEGLPDSSNFDIRYNDVYSPGYQPPNPDLPIGPTNIHLDPLYDDPANGDFHETANSPTIYAGDINAPMLPATDLDGKNRTVCGKVDMGAYQVHPVPPMALSAAPNPVAGGSPVVFSVAVTGNCNVPTGVVTFLDNNVALGTGTLATTVPGSAVGSGAPNGAAGASLSTSFLTVGTHTITATYPGDFNFDPGTSNAVTLTVTGLPTATTLAVQPNPAQALQPVTLTAKVTDPFLPVTGTVTFTASLAGGASTVLGTAPLVNGMAAISTSQLGAGSYAVTASYNATTQFAASSATVNLLVQGNPTTTNLVVVPNPPVAFQPVSVSVSVTASGARPNGSLALLVDGVAPGGFPPSALVASVQLALPAGSHPIVASFAPADPGFAASSAAATLVVNRAPVQLLFVQPLPAPGPQNAPVQLMATFTQPGGHHATGSVVPVVDGVSLTALASPVADSLSFTLTGLAVGTHAVSLSYAGDANFLPAMAATVQITVLSRDFTLSSVPSLSIPTERYRGYALTVTSIGDFNGPVSLSCTDLPTDASCRFQQNPVTVRAGGTATTTVVVDTSALPGYESAAVRGGSGRPWALAMIAPLGLLLLPGMRRRRALPACLLLVLCAAVAAGMSGCSGRIPDSTPPGTYTIHVLAQGDGIAHAQAMQLVVTP